MVEVVQPAGSDQHHRDLMPQALERLPTATDLRP